MTIEELNDFIDEFDKKVEAYDRGEIDDDMSEECRKDWIKKCNS